MALRSEYFLQTQGGKPYDADRLAHDTLRAIGKNKAILVKRGLPTLNGCSPGSRPH
jgi:hypothetical protein